MTEKSRKVEYEYTTLERSLKNKEEEERRRQSILEVNYFLKNVIQVKYSCLKRHSKDSFKNNSYKHIRN